MGKDDKLQFIHATVAVGSAADGEQDINTGIDNPFLSGYMMEIESISFNVRNQKDFADNSRKTCAIATRSGLDIGMDVLQPDIIQGWSLWHVQVGAGAGDILYETGNKNWEAKRVTQVIPYAGSKLYFIAEHTGSADTEEFSVRIGYRLVKASRDNIIEALELWNMPAQ